MSWGQRCNQDILIPSHDFPPRAHDTPQESVKADLKMFKDYYSIKHFIDFNSVVQLFNALKKM